MKLKIEISNECKEEEIIIRCNNVNDTVQKIQAYIQTLVTPKLTFYKGTQEFYLSLDEIIFFETENEQVYAHTKNDAFRVKYRLYELEKMLSNTFIRVAKGTIVNTSHIYAINRNITGASQILFNATHKHIYASRHYYNDLKQTIKGRV